MAIITVSRGTYLGGIAFAEALAKQLDYDCLSREELSDLAADAGIPVGKLQMAIVKPPLVQQHLGPLRSMYLSFITTILVERIKKSGNIVYHGHSGHMLLPSIPNILRVRVVSDIETRVKNVQERLGMGREKGLSYIQDVDRDRERWVRFLYNLDIGDPNSFDFTVNLSQMQVFNAANGLMKMAEMPEFSLTPATHHSLDDLLLSNRVRYILARDKRTSFIEPEVVADRGKVHVRLAPAYVEIASVIPEMISQVEGCSSVNCSIANSSIIWLQDQFEQAPLLCPSMSRIARQWDASVELMRSVQEEGGLSGDKPLVSEPQLLDRVATGGIEDEHDALAPEDANQKLTEDELQKDQCISSSSTVYGGIDEIITSLSRKRNCSLIVLGNLKLSNSEATQKRLFEQLKGRITDTLGIPILSTSEIERQATIGFFDITKVAVRLLLVALLVIVLFHYQAKVISLFTNESLHSYRWLVIIGIMGFVPLFASLYGTSTGTLCRWLKMK